MPKIQTFPDFLASWMIDKTFQPNRRPLKPRALDVLGNADVKDFDFLGRKVKTYHWKNSGPLVFLAHGWSGRALSFYAIIHSLYSQGYSVFTFDGVAHGDSEGKSTSFIEFLHLSNTLLHQIERPQLMIGHSMGGATLINLSHELNLDIPMVLIAPMFSLKKVISNIKKRTRLPNCFVDFMMMSLEKRFQRKVEELETLDKVPNLKAPSLILHDPTDQMTHIENSRKLAAAWPSCQLIEYEGLGHSRILIDPRISDEIIRFMKANEAQ